MSWLAILQLATALLSQALQAFSQGVTKESLARVALPPEHVDTLRVLADEHGV